MQNILFFVKRYIKDLVMVILIIVSLGISFYALWDKEEVSTNSGNLAIASEKIQEDIKEEDNKMVYVDVKGAVKKPGVYQVDSQAIINDVITLAGGFSSTAYKNNINLSKQVSSEMVIYVYTKTEYKKQNTELVQTIDTVCKTPNIDISNCVNDKVSVIENENNSNIENKTDSDNSNINSDSALVNINTADVKAFTSLNGIGEAKAEVIIDYRNKNGNFKNITEIMNVSGIGEALFEKIKDYITV